MKKILIITSGFLPLPPTKGGAVENLTQNIIDYNELHKMTEFIAYSYGDIDTSEYANYKNVTYRSIKKNRILEIIFKVLRKISKGYLPEYFLYAIRRDLKKKKDNIDVALIENRPVYTIYTKKHICKNVVLHTHNEWYDESPEKVFESCSKIIVVSAYIKRIISKYCDEKKIKVVFNAVNEKLLFSQVDQKIIEKIKNKWNITKSNKVILFTGKLKAGKGALELVKAFNAANLPNAKLILAGADADDAEYVNALKNEIDKNKHIIKTGYIQYSELANLYTIADLQVIPSQCNDACPLTVIEGVCFGLPQIVSDGGGIPEEIAPGGAIVIKRDENFVSNLTNALQETINNTDKLNQMAALSKKYSKNYKNELFCKKIIEETTE